MGRSAYETTKICSAAELIGQPMAGSLQYDQREWEAGKKLAHDILSNFLKPCLRYQDTAIEARR